MNRDHKRFGLVPTLLLGMVLVISQSSLAQDVGAGVVRFTANENASESFIRSNVFTPFCFMDGTGCVSLSPLLYPQLFGVDADTGQLVAGGEGTSILATAVPEDRLADEIIITLRQDLYWSDGVPITAYDVLYSLMMYSEYPYEFFAMNRKLLGVRFIDAYTLGLRFSMTAEEIARNAPDGEVLTSTCDVLPRSNFMVLPAHQFRPRFSAFVDDFIQQRSGSNALARWQLAFTYGSSEYTVQGANTEMITAGEYTWVDTSLQQLIPMSSEGSALMTQAGDAFTGASNNVNHFMRGETNVLLNPLFNQRAGLRDLVDPNRGNLQIVEVPSQQGYIVQLNFADTRRPLPAFHPETGEPVEQGEHPILSHLRVRQALQLAIDPEAIIDTVFQQSAMPMDSLFAPTSWAYEPLEDMGFNLQRANQLLEEAGWFRTRPGMRFHQATQRELVLTLGTFGSSIDHAVAMQLASQWGQIGVQVYVQSGEDARSALSNQRFDAFLRLTDSTLYEQLDPDRTRMLTPISDVLSTDVTGAIENHGSYNNPEVTTLLETARTVSDCDPALRASYYQQVSQILQEDLPFLRVVRPLEFYAAAPNVMGFDPRSGDPLWNVRSWRVSP